MEPLLSRIYLSRLPSAGESWEGSLRGVGKHEATSGLERRRVSALQQQRTCTPANGGAVKIAAMTKLERASKRVWSAFGARGWLHRERHELRARPRALPGRHALVPVSGSTSSPRSCWRT